MIRDTINRLGMCPEWDTCGACKALRMEVQTAEAQLEVAERRYWDAVRRWRDHDVEHTLELAS